MNWAPLGELAILISCDDEAGAARLAHAARSASWPWLVDVVQAYASVAVYFDREIATRLASSETVVNSCSLLHKGIAREISQLDLAQPTPLAPRRHVIPVCYERQLDLDRVAQHTGLSADEIIDRHRATTYTVYSIGFCPGFPYLGYLPAELANVPRLSSPRVRVPAGSVGLTGRQTGIYTEPRPGGWNIIGQTPLELVNVADEYFPLRTGDEVRFQRIDEKEFAARQGERLLTTPPDCVRHSSLDTDGRRRGG